MVIHMILDDIIEKRKIQLEREKSAVPFAEIKKKALNIDTPCRDFYKALNGEKLSVISEVKKASPSKSVIKEDFKPVEINCEVCKRFTLLFAENIIVIFSKQSFHSLRMNFEGIE